VFIVFGIGQMDSGALLMMQQDLLFVGDEVTALKGVAGNGGAGYGQLQCQVQLDRGINDSIEAEDLLFPVGVLGVAAHTDSGVLIRGEFRTTEEEGVSTLGKIHPGECSSFDNQVETGLLKSFLEAEDLVEETWPFRISFLQGQGEHFDLGPRYIWREALRGAMDLDTDFLPRNQPAWISKAVEHPATDIFDDVTKLYKLTLSTKVSAALIAGVAGKEGSVGGENLIGEEAQKLGDLHQHMKDPIVEFLPQPVLKVGDGGLTGQMLFIDTGILPVVFPPVPVTECEEETFHVGVFFKVAEEFQQEEAHRVIGKAPQAVLMRDDGADEGKIHQGGDKAGQAPYDVPVVPHLDVAAFIGVAG